LLICFTFCPISIYVAIKIANQISWTEFKIVGASEAFQSKFKSSLFSTLFAIKKCKFIDIYRQSGFFTSLLKIDMSISLSTLLLELNKGPYVDTLYRKLVLIIGIPFCFLFFVLGYKAVINNNNLFLFYYNAKVVFILC